MVFVCFRIDQRPLRPQPPLRTKNREEANLKNNSTVTTFFKIFNQKHCTHLAVDHDSGQILALDSRAPLTNSSKLDFIFICEDFSSFIWCYERKSQAMVSRVTSNKLQKFCLAKLCPFYSVGLSIRKFRP
jgi:hypothetical protein